MWHGQPICRVAGEAEQGVSGQGRLWDRSESAVSRASRWDGAAVEDAPCSVIPWPPTVSRLSAWASVHAPELSRPTPNAQVLAGPCALYRSMAGIRIGAAPVAKCSTT